VTDDYFASPRPPARNPYPQQGSPYQPQGSPYGSPYGQQHPGWAPPQPAYGPPVQAEYNAMAIVSLMLAVMGFAAIAAIIGHMARTQIRQRRERGDGLALAGIIVGWIMTALYVPFCGLLFLGLAAGA
jgi:hypothetical protein